MFLLPMTCFSSFLLSVFTYSSTKSFAEFPNQLTMTLTQIIYPVLLTCVTFLTLVLTIGFIAVLFDSIADHFRR